MRTGIVRGKVYVRKPGKTLLDKHNNVVSTSLYVCRRYITEAEENFHECDSQQTT